MSTTVPGVNGGPGPYFSGNTTLGDDGATVSDLVGTYVFTS